jgi:hypothetical protein
MTQYITLVSITMNNLRIVPSRQKGEVFRALMQFCASEALTVEEGLDI